MLVVGKYTERVQEVQQPQVDVFGTKSNISSLTNLLHLLGHEMKTLCTVCVALSAAVCVCVCECTTETLT